MLLSSQLFDRIIGMSGETGRQSTVLPVGCRRAPENRQVSRMAFGQRTQICLDSGKNAGVWETVMVKDISTKGIGILCNESIVIGCTFMLKLTDKEGDTIRIRCKARRCERGGFGSTAYLLGATFEQVIQQQLLRVNDEPGDTAHWQNQVRAEDAPVVAETEVSGFKTAGNAMAKAAATFLRAVDPSQWMRKADDFS